MIIPGCRASDKGTIENSGAEKANNSNDWTTQSLEINVSNTWLSIRRKLPNRDKKGKTEDEMVGRHHRLNGHGFGWTPGVGNGQGGLACCGSWGRKELDMTERLN